MFHRWISRRDGFPLDDQMNARIEPIVSIQQQAQRRQQYAIARENIRSYLLEAIGMLSDVNTTAPRAEIENLQDIRRTLDNIEANLRLIAGDL